MSNLDGLIKGSVDYTDPKNPRLTLNTTLTKDLSFDIRKNDNLIYFKINKLPLTLLMPILGLTETSSFEQALDKWIVYDSSTLDTQARKLLESENKQSSSYTNKFITDTVDKLLDEQIIKEIKIESVTEEGAQTYELSLNPSSETLDYLAEKMRDQKSKTPTYYQATKPSDYIKDLKINLWLDEQSHLVRKLSVVFKLYTPTSSSALTPSLTNLPFLPFVKQEIPVSLVLKLSDFGQDFKVETPTFALTLDEYLKIILTNSETFKKQAGMILDARRKSDLQMIKAALELCYAEREKYVSKLSDLEGCNTLKKVPTDPETQLPYTYNPTKSGGGYTLKTKLSTGEDYSFSNPQ